MKLNYAILGLTLLLEFTSCSKDEDQTPEPITKADIVGSVNLYDEGVTQIDNSNMTVTVDGRGISATTDANGNFTLQNVPFGTYTITYEKTGYGTFKLFNLEHVNTGSPTIISEDPSLGEVSSTLITNLTISTSGNTTTVGATTNPEADISNTRYIRFFFSTQSDVSNENYEAVLQTFPAQITPYNLNLSPESLDALGFQSDQTVYVKCYGESFWSNQYEDSNLGRTVFPNLNQDSADAVSFVVP